MNLKNLPKDMTRGLSEEDQERLNSVHKSCKFFFEKFVEEVLAKRYLALLKMDENEDNLECPNLQAKFQQHLGARRELRRLITLLSDYEI